MREIKFRAWDGENKRMVGPFCVGSELSMAWPPEMQYTGLKDSRNVEIYEGDIWRSEKHGTYVVKFTEGAFHFENDDLFITIGGNLNHSHNYFRDLHDAGEIIGNTCENAELLVDT